MDLWIGFLILVALLVFAAVAGGQSLDLIKAEIRDFVERHHLRHH